MGAVVVVHRAAHPEALTDDEHGKYADQQGSGQFRETGRHLGQQDRGDHDRHEHPDRRCRITLDDRERQPQQPEQEEGPEADGDPPVTPVFQHLAPAEDREEEDGEGRHGLRVHGDEARRKEEGQLVHHQAADPVDVWQRAECECPDAGHGDRRMSLQEHARHARQAEEDGDADSPGVDCAVGSERPGIQIEAEGVQR